MFMKGEFSNRLVQVSLFSAIVYYITAYPVVFEKARKYFPVKFKKTHHLLIFHTFVFAVLMYVLTYFVFDPIVRVVEGTDNDSTDNDSPFITKLPPANNRETLENCFNQTGLNTEKITCDVFNNVKNSDQIVKECSDGEWIELESDNEGGIQVMCQKS